MAAQTGNVHRLDGTGTTAMTWFGAETEPLPTSSSDLSCAAKRVEARTAIQREMIQREMGFTLQVR